MQISRHYLTIAAPGGPLRLHYRRCGTGPSLLMLHQSPRSSGEYEPLMRAWGERFTCIAPDLPGFGQSQPLSLDRPEIGDFAETILSFCQTAGIEQTAAYGFHSGAIILMHCLKREPERFSALALGGYAEFTAAEQARLGEPYIPPNPPKPYGEHLTWLWNRILEQSWYFPWCEPADENRLPFAHDDPARLHAVVLDLLASADAYRHGYGAVLRSTAALPDAGATMPPALLSAYEGDPLADHLDRFAALPSGWRKARLASPPAHWDASFAFLQDHLAPADAPPPIEDIDGGFVQIATDGFTGLIHWQGSGPALALHAPAGSLELVDPAAGVRVDLPGHGLSDPWPYEAPHDWPTWQAVIDVLAASFGTSAIVHAPLPEGDPAQLYPTLTPDRFGSYLTSAWSIVRASQVFAPWYQASKDSTRPIDPAALAPGRLALAHRALIRATAAKELHLARQAGGTA